MKKLITALLVLSFVIALGACGSKNDATTSPPPDATKFPEEDQAARTYSNADFGFTFTAPTDWEKNDVEGAIFAVVNSATGSNLNVIIGESGGLSEKEYAAELKSQLKNSGLDYKFGAETTAKLGSSSFTKITSTVSFSGYNMYQFIYICIKGDTSCVITATAMLDSTSSSEFEAMFTK